MTLARWLKKGGIIWVLLACGLMTFLSIARADDKKRNPAHSVPRTTTITFDDEVVEGMNKNPLDFAQHIGTKDYSDTLRLYKKRRLLRREMNKVLEDLRYKP